MSAIEYDFEIEQGATTHLRFVWKDSTGTPVDLSTYTARMQLRKSVASSEVVLELTTENGGIILGGSTGTIDVVLTAVQTATISRNGVYDLELVNGPVVVRFAQGGYTLSKEVTR